MTRMPSMKRDMDQRLARKIAAEFLKKTGDLYERCELAGSLRRNEQVVHDVDPECAELVGRADAREW